MPVVIIKPNTDDGGNAYLDVRWGKGNFYKVHLATDLAGQFDYVGDKTNAGKLEEALYHIFLDVDEIDNLIAALTKAKNKTYGQV